MFDFLFFVLVVAAVLALLAYNGYLGKSLAKPAMKWLAMILFTIAGLRIAVRLFSGAADNQTDPAGNNACGCAGAVVLEDDRGLFQRTINTQASCGLAQQLVRDTPRRYRIVGCAT